MKTIQKRSLESIHSNIRRELAFLKAARTQSELHLRSIPLEGSECYLLPVAEVHADDDHLIGTLASWRRANQYAYPTRFTVTDGGTKTWLRRGVLDATDRLLFLIMDRHGRPLGHLGFANCCGPAGELEIDNVLRGVRDVEPGLMAAAMRTVVKWADRTIWPSGYFLRVLKSNTHALTFYERIDFHPVQEQGLRLHRSGDRESLEPLAADDSRPADDVFVTMRPRSATLDRPTAMILTAGPSISAREVAYAADATAHGWNARWNGYLESFQRAFAEYVGVKHALATSSGTGALHIALAALGVGPGDEVIVPDITWVATANAVLYVGATPVFADVEPDTWCLDAASFEAKITPRTKAVMPVHLYGHPARMDAVVEIAKRHDLFVVEDAAPSIGAEVAGRRTGSFGHFSAFSFQGAKLAVTGEGGMLVTNDESLYQKALSVWDQGRKPGTFWIQSNGLKYKMANPLAAIGLAQLERNDAMVEAKRRIFNWYEEGLCGVPHIALNREAPWARSIYWMTSLLLDDSAPIDRDGLREALRGRNIDSRPVFPAISQYPIWPRPQPPQPVAKRIGDRAINLPSGVCLDRSQVEYVCRTIRDILSRGP